MTGSGRRRWRALLIGVVVVVVAATAAVANMALLDAAGEDRLGRLRPVDRALTPADGGPATTNRPDGVTGPARTVAPSSTDGTDDDRVEPPGEDRDGDGRGRGRGRDDDD